MDAQVDVQTIGRTDARTMMHRRVYTHVRNWMNVCVEVSFGYAPAAKVLHCLIREVLIVFERKFIPDDEYKHALQP